MRARLVLGVGVLLTVGVLALEMSGSARRTAGSDHTAPRLIAATLPPGGTLCQVGPRLGAEAAGAELYARARTGLLPALHLRFSDPAGRDVAIGELAAGAREGRVTIPLERLGRAESATRVCVQAGAGAEVRLLGETGALSRSSELVDGHARPGRITLLYVRAGSQSWWQMLGLLDRRFALGKASFIGTWALPAAALALLGVWIAAIRLLARELE